MATLAFLGLGQMGTPMAEHLLGAGHDLIVWNRSSERTEPLRARGATVAATPAEAAGAAEAVFTMLTDADALEAVVFGPDGVAETIRPATTLIDMSTIGPAPIRSIAERLPEGVDVLDAPVRGSVDKARARTLGIVVGGPPDVYERWREVLAAMGTPVRVGDLGAGQAVKLVNNAAAIASIALVGEAVGLGERLGLDRAQVLDVLEETYIGPSAAYVRSRLEPGDFAPRFKAALAAKDVHLALDAGAGGPELRLVAAAASWFDDAVALGLGGLDFTAIAAVALGERPSAGDDA